MKKAYVKTQRKSLTLAVALNVNTHTEAREQQLDASKAFDFDGLTANLFLKTKTKLRNVKNSISHWNKHHTPFCNYAIL
jgi:hypothetical protein